MIHRDKFDLVEEIGLAHLIGQLKNVVALGIGHEVGQAHKFLGKRFDARAVGGEFAERADSQHVGHINKLLAIPGVKERAGTRQALGFADLNLFVGRHVDPVLHHRIRPGDADDIELRKVAGKNPHGAAGDHHLVVVVARLEFHHAADSLAVALVAGHLHFHPVRGRALLLKGAQLAAAGHGEQVELAGILQPCGYQRGERLRGRLQEARSTLPGIAPGG